MNFKLRLVLSVLGLILGLSVMAIVILANSFVVDLVVIIGAVIGLTICLYMRSRKSKG
jgi:uncharacterized membrane protein